MTVEVIETHSYVYEIDDEEVEGMSPEEIVDYVSEEYNGITDADIRVKVEETVITNEDGDEFVVPGSGEWE